MSGPTRCSRTGSALTTAKEHPVAKASRKSIPVSAEPIPSTHIVDAGKIVIGCDSDLKVDARVYGWVDKTDWKKRGPKTSSRDIYRLEAQRRLEAGDEVPADMTHKQFANVLCKWFEETSPDVKKPPAALTIERNTRDLWRRYRGWKINDRI
jgi:hypothetical protein